MNSACAACGKPATHKFVKIVNGHLHETFLCDEHAAQSDSCLVKSNLQVTFEQLLAKLFQQASHSSGNRPAPGSDVKCGACGLPLSAYRKTMILGCDRCYESFEEPLLADLRKFHGATKHEGRRPVGFKPRVTKTKAVPVAIVDESEAAAPIPHEPAAPTPPDDPLERLREEMREAVDAEDFERAARLRDRIAELE
jgi:protein arginine kinase activator